MAEQPSQLPSFFADAFNDISAGLPIVVGGHPKGREGASSVSILSKNSPLGIFPMAAPHGVVLNPKKLQTFCAYPLNADTKFRKNIGPAAHSTLPPQCGMFPDYTTDDEEFECNYSAEAYASEFYNRPLAKAGIFPGLKWQLVGATCHFTNTSAMLGAEQALLERCLATPSNITSQEWDFRLQLSGPTLWNEVIVDTYDSGAVTGIFWAHDGYFRSPQKGDSQACQAAQNLKDSGGELPVFEFANFTMGLFTGVDVLKKWHSTLLTGGYKTGDHFRLLNNTEFLSILKSDLCDSGPATFIV